jgi:hypothetical protein
MMERVGDQPFGLVGNFLRRHDCARAYNVFRHFPKEIKFAIAQRMMH